MRPTGDARGGALNIYLALVHVVLAVGIFLVTGPSAFAEDKPPAAPGNEPGKDPGKEDPAKKVQPEEAPVFVLSEKDRKKVAKELNKFLVPAKKGSARTSSGIEKLEKKPINGHSLMEDVAALTEIANASRVFGSKAGRKGAIVTVKVPPDVHGFPGGVGTVNYSIYLPKKYSDRKLWPVLFCLPNTKDFPTTSNYIKDVWQKSPTIKDEFIVVVPTPASKGKDWRTDAKSYARALITLRHVAGTFGASRKTGGPASDYTRIWIDGDDTAALLAARFTEFFAGAILRGSDGKAGSINLRTAGGLNGLPAYCIVNPKKSKQTKYAELLKTDNAATEVVQFENPLAADAEAIAKWMKGLPPRGTPRSIQYTIHNSSFQRHQWINVLRYDSSLDPPASFEAVADRATNTVTVKARGLTQFEISLNDALVDLNNDVTIIVEEDGKPLEVLKGKVARDLGTMLTELIESNQPWRVYPVRIAVDMPTLRRKAAEAEAAKKAKEAAEKKAKGEESSAEVVGDRVADAGVADAADKNAGRVR